MNWLLTEDGFYLLLENGVILQTELPPDLVPVDWTGSLSARYAWHNTAARVARWTNAIAPVYTWTYQMEILSCG